jgi:hypothetical protein
MTQIHKLGIAAALTFAAVGSQAQTIETDYPFVGGTALAAEQLVDARELRQVEPLLVQSNAQGPTVVASQRDSSASSDSLRSDARVRFLRAPDVDPV